MIFTKFKEGICNITLHPNIRQIVLNRLSRDLLFGDDWTNKDQLYRALVKVRKAAGFSDDYV